MTTNQEFNNIEIIEQRFEEYTLNNMGEVLKHIERCGKNCYKSEKNITETSAEKFIDNILKSGHESVIEHAHFIFKMKIEDAELLFNKIGYPALSELRGLNITQYSDDNQQYYYIISGNPRTFRDIARLSGVYVFLDKIPEIFSRHLYLSEGVLADNLNIKGKVIPSENYELVGIQKSGYGDKHNYYTFRFDTSISTYKDITRHRNLSWSIESTRYCVTGDTLLKSDKSNKGFTINSLYERVQKDSKCQWKRLRICQLNEDNKELEYTKIKEVLYIGKKPVLKIKTKFGLELKCTEDHLVYSGDSYIEASNLKVGDNIHTVIDYIGFFKDNISDEIAEISALDKEDVYEIVVDGKYHNFLANGIVVHNCNYSKKNENGKIKIVDCSYFMTPQEHQLYLNEMDKMAAKYNVMANDFNSRPDVLRMILPHGTAASVVMSGSVYDLKKMLALRTDSHAHPTVQHDMKEIEKLMQEKQEVLFLDRRIP